MEDQSAAYEHAESTTWTHSTDHGTHEESTPLVLSKWEMR